MNTQKITDYIFLKSKIEKADLAIIFGTRSEGAAKTIYNLYEKQLVTTILVSGGINKISKNNEANVISQKLISLGVDKKAIILEDKSTNTLENVLFSKDIIIEKIGFDNIKKIVIVVKNYHSRRAMMTIKKHFPKNITFYPLTYEIHGINEHSWFKNEKNQEKVIGEYQKIKDYLKKGDIEEL